ncbi:hypothetical protein [Terasakiella sp.]|uniref:hypothetical protein n=1 Tax=Terasakiella sp. TaxID=2034861 RepID=UPI003AA85131
MADIVQFVPKAGNEAQVNVSDFVKFCRNELRVFGEVDWESSWDITNQLHQRGRSGRIALTWTNYDTSKTNTLADLMAEPFIDFARAYMRYQQGMKPTKSVNLRLSALRALERALVENDKVPDVCKANAAVFNRAAALVKAKYQSSTAYRVAGQLAVIAKFINDHEMVPVRFSWRNTLKRDNDRNRVGKQFDQERSRKLPEPGALDSLAKAFQIATEPADVIIASTGALLTTSPDRINEIFRLPVNCEVEKQNTDGSIAYGIRWWPSKGADPYVKWIAPSMVEVAKLALEKLKNTTQSARDLAFWYEQNPTSLYLPDNLAYLREQEFCRVSEFKYLFGINTLQWIKRKGIDTKNIDRVSYVRFDDL